MSADPIATFLLRRPVMILDGGLATELEARGMQTVGMRALRDLIPS